MHGWGEGIRRTGTTRGGSADTHVELIYTEGSQLADAHILALAPALWASSNKKSKSRHFEDGLPRSFSSGGGKPSFLLTSAGDLRECLRVPLRSQGYCGFG